MRTVRWRVLARVLCAMSLVVVPVTAGAAAPTGQQRAEDAGRGLVGTPAPALVARTIDGRPIDLGELYGRQPVYLKFWATWCSPCRAQMPHLRHVHETAGSRLEVIGIVTGFNDSPADVRAALLEHGLSMPTILDDGELGAAFNLRVTPQHIVIGKDGRIAYVGQRADAQLDAALAQVVATPAGGRVDRAVGAPRAVERHAVGDPLPQIAARTLQGSRVRAAFVFFSPWCESYYADSRPALARSCRDVREQVAALARDDAGVRWVGIASRLWATAEEVQEYATKYSPGIPVMLDDSGDWFRSFGVMHVPTIIIAAASGRIEKRIEGFDAKLAAAIRGRTMP